MLNLKSVTKDYLTASETVRALKGVSIAFRKNEFVSILGPSGCGKTTLLNIIGGLDKYTDGDLIIGGRSTKDFKDKDWDIYRNHRIGFIFQSYNLIPHQTVLGNVELALTIAGISREERISRAKNALDRVGLKGQYYKRPNQLSGGQCQRVAIARALVNDPEILLADEPTGALDTVTSVQIMDLIKEISAERLVIMVTHNPELAETYSSRIVRLLDGEVIEDTNPFTSEDEEAECVRLREEEAERERAEAALLQAEAAEKGKAKKKRRKAGGKREKAKMSFFTAFMLSARNLLSKKGRTAMVGFAGSIGIIGIALVLAFSSGIHGYIDTMQNDMLSGNPIKITEAAYDLDALTSMMSTSEKLELIDKVKDTVYVSSVIEYLVEMNKDLDKVIMENTITEDYIKYIKSMPKELCNAILLDYGINMSNSIYTSFSYKTTDEIQKVSVSNIIDMYTSILSETDFKDYASSISLLAPSFQQAPNNTAFLESQYELLGGGKIASEKDEVMLVLNSDDELSDILLAMLGYFNQSQFEEIIRKANLPDGEEYKDTGLYKDYFTYEELLRDDLLTWYPNNTIFTKNPDGTYKYNHNTDGFTKTGDESGAVKLKVVGILTTKENINYGSLKSGIYYTEALTNHMLETNRESEILEFINSDLGRLSLMSSGYRFKYDYKYRSWSDDPSAAPKISDGVGTIGEAQTLEKVVSSMAGSMAGGMGGAMGGGMGGSSGGAVMPNFDDMKEALIRSLGANSTANEISIYPVSLEEKPKVIEYLDAWNGDGTVYADGAEITRENRDDVEYTDALGLVMSIITTMVDVVTIALIAFTSISLVVSTVMIGIITYVSVVERIKEIGVIRSLGGRKKDVGHLFNAETFIIGLLAGLFGIAVTYIVSALVNVIVGPMIGYPAIAALPVYQAAILIVLSVGLTLISGLIPASSAANKDPVVALRTE